MKKIKILAIGLSEVVNTVGGGIKVFIDFCNELSVKKYEMTGCCYADENTIPAGLNSDVKFVNLKLLYNNLSYSQSLNEYLEVNKTDLIVFFFPHLYTEADLSSKYAEIPKILMFHSRPDWYFASEKVLNKIKDLSRCDNIVSHILLPSFKKLLPDFMQDKQTICIPNALNLPSQYADIKIEKKKIIYLSRIDPLKGINFLMESFALIATKYPDWEIHIYGQSTPADYEEKLKAVARKLKIDKQFIFKGITNNPLNTFLDYDFCAFPSFFEGFGLGLAEAMSVGLPAVGLQKCSAVNELIIDGKNGFLSHFSPKMYAQKIESLILNKGLREKMGIEAANRVKEFDKKYIFDKWDNIIKKIVSGEKCLDNNIAESGPAYPLFTLKELRNSNMQLNFLQKIFSIKKIQKGKISRTQVCFLGIKFKSASIPLFKLEYNPDKLKCILFGIKISMRYNIASRYKKVLKRLRKKFEKEKIVIGFLVNEQAKWQYQSLYDELEKSNCFKPVVLVTQMYMAHNGEKSFYKNIDDCYNFFRNKDVRVQYVYDKKKHEYTAPENFGVDIVFYQQPWELDKTQSPARVSNSMLTCYVPYGLHLMKKSSIYSINFHHKLWKIFIEDKGQTERIKQSNCDYADNCIYTGYPKLDEYFNHVRETHKKRIIYAPHHSFEDWGLGCATFQYNGMDILRFAQKNKDKFDWVFKPHPRFKHAVIINNIMTEKEINSYYDAWANIGSIYEDGDYIKLFINSDALITDCISFLGEYLPSENPVFHLISQTADFNEFAKSFIGSFYSINNMEELENEFKNVLINKNDYKKEERLSKIGILFDKKEKAATKIINCLIRELRGI